MKIDYYKMPFGAQLLLWTSRIIFYGNCRISPNKYEIVNIAFEKVGIKKGSLLLKPFLYMIKEKGHFKLQRSCVRYLNEQEINLINCIEDYKSSFLGNDCYINLWNLENEKELFNSHATKLACSFKDANLDTNLNSRHLEFNNYENAQLTSRALH